MNAVIRQLLVPLWNSLGVVALFAVPLFAVGWLLNHRRKRFRAQALDPFTEIPLRPPGESIRLKIEELVEEFDNSLAASGFASVAAMAVAVTASSNSKPVVVGVGFVAMCILLVYFGRQMFAVQKKLWDYRLGFAGERAVGEELNQLLADGFLVFHDVPFDGFNIDHVIVGPPGVYAVETKAYRKPADIKGVAKATVIFDGEALHFPRRDSIEELEQARDNSVALSKWLSKATGEPTQVNAILTFPGWMVVRKARGTVNVLNSKEIRYSFPRDVERPLDSKRIQRIAHQLTERCRMPKT